MRIPVVYNEKQTVTESVGFSPSARKPELVVNSWKQLNLPLEFVSSFLPLTSDQLAIAHDYNFVLGVLNLNKKNGFGNKLKSVAESLPWTNGSFYHACLLALSNGQVAVSPTSGFHHAHFDEAGDFCTFNGLMIAALLLQKEKKAKKISIIDCDVHYGNGTDNILHLLANDGISHWTFGKYNYMREDGDHFINRFPAIIEKEIRNADIIFYQAGADPHLEDPLGGVLTSEQMKERDHILFSIAKQRKIPVCWNLAGGYQKPIRKVLDLHDATMRECVKIYLD